MTLKSRDPRLTDPYEWEQGSNEEISYSIEYHSPPISLETVVVYDETTEEDVTDATMPLGTHALNALIVRLKPLKNLVIGHVYRVTVTTTNVGGNKLEDVFKVTGI